MPYLSEVNGLGTGVVGYLEVTMNISQQMMLSYVFINYIQMRHRPVISNLDRKSAKNTNIYITLVLRITRACLSKLGQTGTTYHAVKGWNYLKIRVEL